MAWKCLSRPCLALPPALLDDEDFTLGGVALGAVGQLSGQRRGLQRRLAAGQVAGLAGGLPGAGGGEALVQHGTGRRGVLLQVGGQLLADHGIHQRADLAVAQLGLGLALELGLHQLDGHDGGQALAHVVAGQVGVVGLEHAGLSAIVVDDIDNCAMVVFHGDVGQQPHP